MPPSEKKQIVIGIEHLISFESEMSSLYYQLMKSDAKFSEFWESAALLKACRAKIYKKILADYSGAGEKYSLIRGLTGPFVNLITKIKTFRNSTQFETGYSSKVSDFLNSIEDSVVNNKIWPVVEGQTMMFKKSGQILSHIQYRQIRLIRTMSRHRAT